MNTKQNTNGLIMVRRSWLSFATVALVLAGGVALADDEISATVGAADAMPYEYDKGVYRGMPWISGGVGQDERDYLLGNFADDYNLKLEFAQTDGDYMSDISVTISQQGNQQGGDVVVAANSSGPWFMVALPEGSYGVEVSGDGQRFERTVEVPAIGLETVVFAGWAD